LTNDEPQKVEVGADYFMIRHSPFGNLRFVVALGAARPRADQVVPFSECGNYFGFGPVCLGSNPGRAPLFRIRLTA
jgi:hypothetical protein